MVSGPLPEPWLLAQPKPCCSMPAASGSLPTLLEGAAPCVLPKEWPPAMSGHRLFVVHGHATKGVADIPGRCYGVGVAVGAFGVHVDEAHVCSGQRRLELA